MFNLFGNPALHSIVAKFSLLKEGTNAMPQERLDNRLHLPDLSIEGFRGIEALTIERLGRVTLLAGKNSVGKTTVLDAVRVYAARGRSPVLSELLKSREEVYGATDEDGDRIEAPDFAALFHGRDTSGCVCISIGPKSGTDQLRIEETSLSDEQASVSKNFYLALLRMAILIRHSKSYFKARNRCYHGCSPFKDWLRPEESDIITDSVHYLTKPNRHPN